MIGDEEEVLEVLKRGRRWGLMSKEEVCVAVVVASK